MTIRLDDLTPFQIRAMIRLDDGFDPVDSVGRRIEDLTNHQLVACCELIELGLAQCRVGWRDTAWFSLTPAGRRVRDGAV